MSQKIDDYIRKNWPKKVPRECMELLDSDDQIMDCLERGKKKPCLSCLTFDRLDIKARKINKEY